MRKHYSHNHPAVMAWTPEHEAAKNRGQQLEHAVLKYALEKEMHRNTRLRKLGVRFRAVTGLVTILIAGLTFDQLEKQGEPPVFAFFILIFGCLTLVSCMKYGE